MSRVKGLALSMLAAGLVGCAQAPAGPAHVLDAHAVRYLAEHGARVEVVLPAGALVTAAPVVDPDAAAAAKARTDDMAASMRGNGLVGLAVTAAVSAHSGVGALQRKAQASAAEEARPLASVLAAQPTGTLLEGYYRAGARQAGLREGTGMVTGRWVFTPQVLLSADRMHLVLSSVVRLEDLAGGLLYSAQVDVGSPSMRRCGSDCIDSGELDALRVNAALEACAAQTLQLVALDLQGAATAAPERTLRYVLDGQRVIERGRPLPTAPGYVRYVALGGALKAMPVVLEQGLAAAPGQ